MMFFSKKLYLIVVIFEYLKQKLRNMPVVKPGGNTIGGGGRLAASDEKPKEKIDFTFIVPKGATVKIEYED